MRLFFPIDFVNTEHILDYSKLEAILISLYCIGHPQSSSPSPSPKSSGLSGFQTKSDAARWQLAFREIWVTKDVRIGQLPRFHVLSSYPPQSTWKSYEKEHQDNSLR